MPPAPPHAFLSFLRLTPYTPPPSHRGSFDPDLGTAPPQWFRTLSRPRRMGNAANYAYGGYALSLAVYAACQSVWLEGQVGAGGSLGATAATATARTTPAAASATAGAFTPYSAQGVYLRPALTDRPFAVRVGCLRRTRTFRTMEVRVYQPQVQPPSKEDRLDLCLTAVVDCMARSKGGVDRSILRFTTPPSPPSAVHPTITHHSALASLHDSLSDSPSDSDSDSQGGVRGERGAEATAPQSLRKAFRSLFAPLLDMFETRCPNEGIWAQNMWGLLPGEAEPAGRGQSQGQGQGRGQEDRPAEGDQTGSGSGSGSVRTQADAGGLGAGHSTTQDPLRMSDKRGYEWLRPRGALPFCEAGSVGAAFESDTTASSPSSSSPDSAAVAGSPPSSEEPSPSPPAHLPIPPCASQPALTAFLMDAALSFAPLSFSRRFLPDAAACASLDFALRFHDEPGEPVEPAGAGQAGEPSEESQGPWYLREIKPCESAWERTYSEGKLWREGADGLKCVATMTQACVLKSKGVPAEREGQARL